jgi:hypothetical protein
MNTTIQKIVYGAFAASVLAACSSEEFYDQAKKNRLDYGNDVASEVPVLIGAGTTQTSTEKEIVTYSSDFQFKEGSITSKSGAINSNVDTKAFSIQDGRVGIFMLAKDIIPGNDYSDVTWEHVNWANHDKPVSIADIGEYVDKWSAPIWNKAANVTMYDTNGMVTTDIAEGAKSSVGFVGEQPYYPIGNYCSYSLYGYYPLQSLVTDGANKNCTVDKSKLAVTIPVTGKDDILWGRASYSENDVEGTDIKWFTPGEPTGVIYDGKEITDFTKYGYSAKFFRFSPFRTKDGTDKPLAPTMKFFHKMIMLKFDVIAGGTPIDKSESEQIYDFACKTTVSGLTIDNTPSSVDLVIADLSGAGNEGKVTASTTTTRISIDGSATPKLEDGKPVRVTLKDANGDDAYVILPAGPASNYHLSLTLTDNNVEPAVSKVIPVPLNLKTKGSFEEGKIYRIILKVWNLESLQLDATLDAWEEIEPTEENWNKYPFITEGDHTIPVH